MTQRQFKTGGFFMNICNSKLNNKMFFSGLLPSRGLLQQMPIQHRHLGNTSYQDILNDLTVHIHG